MNHKRCHGPWLDAKRAGPEAASMRTPRGPAPRPRSNLGKRPALPPHWITFASRTVPLESRETGYRCGFLRIALDFTPVATCRIRGLRKSVLNMSNEKSFSSPTKQHGGRRPTPYECGVCCNCRLYGRPQGPLRICGTGSFEPRTVLTGPHHASHDDQAERPTRTHSR